MKHLLVDRILMTKHSSADAKTKPSSRNLRSISDDDETVSLSSMINNKINNIVLLYLFPSIASQSMNKPTQKWNKSKP